MNLNSLLSISMALQTLPPEPAAILSRISLANIFYAILVMAVVYLLIRVSDATLDGLGRKAPRARFFFKMLSPLVRFALWVCSGIIILSIFSP